MFSNRSTNILALAAFVAVGIMAPDFKSARRLDTESGLASNSVQRALQAPTAPPGFDFTCSAGEIATTVKWGDVSIQENQAPNTQNVVLSNGMPVTLTTSKTENAQIAEYKQINNGEILFTARIVIDETDVIGATNPMTYPDDYITLKIQFEEELSDLYISIGDVDSTNSIADATRVRMEDGLGNSVPLTMAKTGTIEVVDNFAYETVVGKGVGNPGRESSLYALANGKVQTIYLDQSVFAYSASSVGSLSGKRGVFPALDFRYCAPPVQPAPAPACATKRTLLTDDLTGWSNNQVMTNDGALGTYLGKFGKNDPTTTKTYTLPADAATATSLSYEFTFLEIDSWDGTVNNDIDFLKVVVNGVECYIGYFNWKNDEGDRSGDCADGTMTWSSEALTANENVGGSTWNDQFHAVKIKNIDPSSGSLSIGFEVNVNQNKDDESGGFREMEIVGNFDCSDQGGVNGDPLIMGLAGQLFKFDGRSGAWYSAVSAPSFQWNMRIQEYEECPAESNKFVSGVGFSLFKKGQFGRQISHQIVVNVVNEHMVQTGCGTEATNCLGNGSLELIIDGKKFVYPGDYQFKDGSGRVIAFNTYYECARKWYDFDITPAEQDQETSLRAHRKLNSFPGVFDVVRGLEDTMVDKQACDGWIEDRQKKNDLFHQAGEWSTIIVKTDRISFHVEYKQEHKRCSAHTVDVWIASVSPDLYDEDWEGVIGETKDPANHGGEKVERTEFLKFPDDESYEVTGPSSTKCPGCYAH